MFQVPPWKHDRQILNRKAALTRTPESQSKPRLGMVYPEPCKSRIEKGGYPHPWARGSRPLPSNGLEPVVSLEPPHSKPRRELSPVSPRPQCWRPALPSWRHSPRVARSVAGPAMGKILEVKEAANPMAHTKAQLTAEHRLAFDLNESFVCFSTMVITFQNHVSENSPAQLMLSPDTENFRRKKTRARPLLPRRQPSASFPPCPGPGPWVVQEVRLWVKHTVDGCEIRSHHLETMVQTIVCWCLQGNPNIPAGFLGWCRISSIHSRYHD